MQLIWYDARSSVETKKMNGRTMNVYKLVGLYAVVVAGGAMMVAALAEKKDMESKRGILHSVAALSRKTDFPVEPIFIERWSPRALSPKEITDEELMPLFEAARWAPSSYNAQPWRFIYAKRGTENWNTLFNLMVPFNQAWACNASALVLMVSYKYFPHNGEFSRTHAFDAGAAWQNFALQASQMGLVAHGMAGFDYDRAKIELNISDDYEILMMIAVGRPGNSEDLPADLRTREEPSIRKPVSTFAFEGKLP
ncbi:MAG: malonic semialdehyde reductase [Candidatus Dependentiae bacterium ADurb.Bin331]|nr:MAG: malonic semialdehyde reductase [Candidatus Dependentiae bacterium ADurb.Bin331]